MLHTHDAEVYSSRNWSDTPAASASQSLAGTATVMFDFVVGQHLVSFEGRERDRTKWERIATRLDKLATAEHGWDSYGALRLRTDALLAAIDLLNSIFAAGGTAPFLTMTTRGGLHLEWSTDGREAEVEIADEADQLLLLVDESMGIEAEQRIFSGRDVVDFLHG